MNNLVKSISPSDIIFKPVPPATKQDYSSENQYMLTDKYVLFGTSTSISKPNDKVSEQALFEINKLYSFLMFPENWDSYNAAKPSKAAVENAIGFIFRLAQRQQFPYFIAPSPNGDILVELKAGNVNLEFTFRENGFNRIVGLLNNEEAFDKELNETNEYCSLKWMYCPDGDCSNWE